MYKRKFLAAIFSATLLLGATGATFLVQAQKQKPAASELPPGHVPPAGEYACFKSIWSTTGALNMDGTPMMTIQYISSAIGSIEVDGKGGYRVDKKAGRYHFDPARREFAFVTGPLAGWPVVYEVTHGTPRLRLAAKKGEKVTAKSRIGEHDCDLKSKIKFANSPPPASVGDPATVSNSHAPRNGGARGTLVFRQEWGNGPSKIVELNLASGAIQSRFEGSDPHRNARGETAFINRTGALVIADANGTATSTISVPQSFDTPDSPVLSPDNSKIAFHVAPNYYSHRVLVATRAGKIIGEFKDMTEPNWTSDNRLIVAKSTRTEGAKPGIFLSDSSLQELKRIDPNLDSASQPAVSPDGRRVAFVQHGHIWLMDLDGSHLKQLSVSDGGEKSPTWSPDGQWLAATKDDGTGIVLLISVSSGKIIKANNSDDKDLQSSGRLNWR